jgi:hypothetical protein
MDAKQLTEAITDGGIASTNFFNGRLLSGEDLTREQESNREARRRLGQAIGSGIAYGLEVSTPPDVDTRLSPMVRIEAGMAVNARGETLVLGKPIQVSLVRQPDMEGAATVTDLFKDCLPPQAGVYAADAGVYLLAISPAASRSGRAPVSGLGNIAASCNTRYTVESVQFRLVQIPLSGQELSSANAQRLRNQIAYKCFGYGAVRSFIADLFGSPPKEYGMVEDLPASRLNECDVPLALLYWTSAGGINFVDLWSVRRRLAHRSAGAQWSVFVDERRAREGEAMFQQFEEHARSLLATQADPQTVIAKEHFERLPPVGIIPIASPSLKGFDYLKFFEGVTYREPVYMEGARVESLLRYSFSYAPVDLSSGELFWLYWVSENAQAVINSAAPVQTCMIFSSGQMPFAAAPRFDASHWDYGNYV